jgi:hypothetical protein
MQRSVPAPGQSQGDRDVLKPPDRLPASASLPELVAKAFAALASAEKFRNFADEFDGAYYEIWNYKNNSLPTPLAGDAPPALLWAAHGKNNIGYFFPAFGMKRQLTLWTSDNGRYAGENLGWLYKIEGGPQMCAIQPAEVDLRTGKIRKTGVLQLPLE